jgi:tRNA pseudouridine55 synthase
MTSITANPRDGETAADGAKLLDNTPPETPTLSNRSRRAGKGPQFRREKYDVHGWVVLDKPVGMTSTYAVSVIKRLFSARRAGHAGTLDPLASGCRS